MKVKLTKPHTHAGTSYAAGDQIDVSAVEAEWLRTHGVIEADSKASNGGAPALENNA